MVEHGGRRQAALRYLLVQLPALALLVLALLLADRWVALPAWLFWGIIALWVAKDAALFPLAWRAYLPGEPPSPMLGARGVAVERLDPAGYVRVGGELWRAEAEAGPVEAGEAIRVVEVHGLSLRVRPARGEEAVR